MTERGLVCPFPGCEHRPLSGTAAANHLSCATCLNVFANPLTLTSACLEGWRATGLAIEEGLYLEAAGISAVEGAECVRNEVQVWELREWREQGFSAFETGWWFKHNVFDVDHALSWRVMREPMDTIGLLRDAGFVDPVEIARWTNVGFTLNECIAWRPQVRLKDWDRTDVYDTHYDDQISIGGLAAWKRAGFPPPAFQSWSRFFDDPDEAWRYRSAGLTPSDATDCRENNLTIEEWLRRRPATPSQISSPKRPTDVRHYVRSRVTIALGVRSKTDGIDVAAALIADKELIRNSTASGFLTEFAAAGRELIDEAIPRTGLRAALLSSGEYRKIQHMFAATRLGGGDEDYDSLELQFNRSLWAGELEGTLAERTGARYCDCAICKVWTRR